MVQNKTLFIVLGSLKVGGVEKVATRIQESLAKRGYSVYLVLLKELVELPVFEPDKILFLETEKYRKKSSKIFNAIRNLWKLKKQHNPSLLISLSSGMNALLLFSFFPRMIFCVDTNLFAIRKKYPLRILKWVGYLPNIKKVIVPSQELRLAFKESLPQKSFSKFITIPNPIDLTKKEVEPYIKTPSTEVFVSIGRLTRSKGYEQLIRCFARAKFKKAVELWIVGSGPQENELLKLVESFSLTDRIKFFGFQSFPEKYLINADAFILNTEFESFGNVFIEALKYGIPVISNDCDFGPREIIKHGKNGLLYDNSKDENLISVLEDYVNKNYKLQLIKYRPYDLSNYQMDVIGDMWEEKVLKNND